MTEDYPSDVLYHPQHDWVRVDGDVATFGITWYAQDSLGEIVYWSAPTVGSSVTKDEAYAELESVKAVTDVIAPISGRIIEVNAQLQATPSIVNDDPYGSGWLVRVHPSASSELESLLDLDAYRELL